MYCLPSKNEGMPMSVLEAMSHGIPTIATAVGGVPRLIESGTNGFLIKVDDVNNLAHLIDKLLFDSELRKEIGDAGRKVVADRFNSKHSIEQILNL